MLRATSSFMEAIEKWVKAARSDDLTTARYHAENMVRSGELLAIHPDFMRCLARRDPLLEPRAALLHLCEFLLCATDGRAAVLKNNAHGKSQEIF